MDKIEIVTSYVKLANYLNKNQLVQAHAMTQRMDAQFKDAFNEEGKEPDTHPLFEVYRLAVQIQQMIVLGNRDYAIQLCSQMRLALRDKQALQEIKQILGD
jgi:hypothetical protein